MKFEVDETVLNSLLAYLENKPWRESNKLIQAIMQSKPLSVTNEVVTNGKEAPVAEVQGH